MPKKQNEEETWIFSGVSSPNTTQVPDQYLDELLPILSGAELKVLLYITRRTFGFKKESDNISLSQMLHGIKTRDGRILDRGTGLSKPTLLQALRSLQDKQIIETERQRSPEKGDEPTVYKLKFAEGPAGQKTIPPLVKKVDQGGGKEISPGGWSKDLTTQQTVLQQTDINTSNTRKASPKNDKTTAVHGEPDPPPDTLPPFAGGSNPKPESTFAARGLAAIGDVLANRRQRSQRYDEDRQVIVDLLSDFRREFNDQSTLKQSVSRAYNLMQRSDLDIGTFTSRMYEARAITKERSASITSVLAGSTSLSAKHKMAYWFSVLEDLLGLKPTDAIQSGPSGEQT